jgi:hypothetical protein
LAGQVAELQQEVQFAGVHDTVQDITTTLGGLPGAVLALRSQGYLYSSSLEGQAQALAQQWETLRSDILAQAQAESRGLSRDMASVSGQVQSLQSAFVRSAALARPLYPAAASAVENLTAKVQGVQSRLGALYGGVSQQMYALKVQVNQLGELLKLFQSATFSLQPGESPLDATPATYLRDKDEGPEGLLYLTNHRLLFEQKEEVATKKVLFVTTEKELIQRLLLDQPVGYIQQVEGSEKGFAVFKKEMLTVQFAPESGLGKSYFRLKEDSEAWQALIRRVTLGEIEQERVGAAPESAAERAEAEQAVARELPTVCPTCGAPLGQRIARGVQSLACDYCGAAIRV